MRCNLYVETVDNDVSSEDGIGIRIVCVPCGAHSDYAIMLEVNALEAMLLARDIDESLKFRLMKKGGVL